MAISLLFVLFIPLMSLFPNLVNVKLARSFDDYFFEFKNQLFNTPKFFIALFILSLIFYILSNYRLLFDLFIDYLSSTKNLGLFLIKKKKKLLNGYLLITTDPNFECIKVDRKVFNKIKENSKIEIVVSHSKRAYRYNPTIKDFKIDKLI